MTHLKEIQNYWDNRATGYSHKSVAELHSQDAIYWNEQLQQYLPEGDNLTCLDMGCGPGFLGILLGKLGHQVTFADYSPRMLEEAKVNAKGQGTFIQCDAQNPQFPDNTFDVIVCRNLVWNLEQPETAYEQWLRILKPGGKLIVFDGNHYLYQTNGAYAPPMEEDGRDPHRPEVMEGVDPDVMAKIAQDLPLSPIPRPRWDMEFFLSRHVTQMAVTPHYQKGQIASFALAIQK